MYMSIIQVNENFIKPGHVHETTRFGANEQQTTVWRPIYIESIEVIGGQVFLGLRDVFTEKQGSVDEKDYTVLDIVYYENMFMFSRIQRLGIAVQRDQKLKLHSDKTYAKQLMQGHQLRMYKTYVNDVVNQIKQDYPGFDCEHGLEYMDVDENLVEVRVKQPTSTNNNEG